MDEVWKGRLAAWERINNTVEVLIVKAKQGVIPTEIVSAGKT